MRMLVAALALAAAFVQNSEFEVASVKRASDDSPVARLGISSPVAEQIGFEGGPGSKTPGRIRYSGVTLKMILARAYGLRSYQITGPGWLDTERYEIEARYPAETNLEDFCLMLQNLLSDRFHLVAHRETREMLRYRLVVAKGGPKLSPPKKPPEYKNEEERKATVENDIHARMEAMRRTPHPGGYRSWSNGNATVDKLAEMLSGNVDRPVTDDTGLDGSYSFSLEWSPHESVIPAENSLPSIFGAVQQQLGLKLQPERGPVEFLIVDSAEKTPVAN